MTVEALSSNVVNYLVWRYLQEAGYGNAALQLSRSWIRDPETLPFAKNVTAHTLINILQDGLWFDKLQADVSQSQRRYRFGLDHGRPFSLRNGDTLTLDPGAHPREAHEDVNGSAAESVPRKGAKRKRKTNGVVDRGDPRVNGDAMDLDHNGVTQMPHSIRGESEAVVSDIESPIVEEIPISTLSIGQSTEIQTEKVVELAPDTTFVKIQEDDKVLTHTLWGPPESPLLLTAGKSLLRLHHIPSYSNSGAGPPEPQIRDLNLPLNNFNITAICWNSHREATLAAREEQVNEEGETMKTDKLVKLIDGGQDARILSSVVGMVSTLRWNESSQTLLSISTSDVAGSIKVWKDDDTTPAFTAFTDCAIMDAAWMTNMVFVVCGFNFLQIYDIEGEELKRLKSFDVEGTWESVKYDPICDIIACASFEEGLMGIVHPDNPTTLKTQEYPDSFFSDMGFRPIPNPAAYSSSLPRLLATCSGSGAARIWNASRPFECIHHLVMEDYAPANCLSFSPDGFLLAAAGLDTITVWNPESGGLPKAVWKWNGSPEEWDSTVEGESSLGWDPDGKKLAFALGNQIAVINFQR
ncbi:WD40 repeat-like protein [Lepidopterella palustris CBS 459.81]|uniref:WD40 repeat-like protein n=1 Tax=Lepidopterella palustris CBS 459.81 TaxID=1314670 RepID=A0A8E2E9K1_9PEZI|nr:WD40 repeat-like protein [Lepidopterella palustris CBS 459.81]